MVDQRLSKHDSKLFRMASKTSLKSSQKVLKSQLGPGNMDFAIKCSLRLTRFFFVLN